MTEIVVDMPNTNIDLVELAKQEYKKLLEKQELEKKLQYEKEQMYLNDEICEICYGTAKCKKHICKECNNSVCIDCICKLKTRKDDKYILKCPFCRTDETYNYYDLSKEDLIKFYINLDDTTAELLRPVKKRHQHLDYIKTIMDETTQVIRNSKDSEDNKFKLYSTIERFTNDIKEVITDKNTQTLQVYKEKLEEFREYKKIYDEYEKYRAFMKNAYENQKKELQQQSFQLQQQSLQLQEVIKQNKELLISTNSIKKILESPDYKRQPKQSIKTIGNIIKPVVEKQEQQQYITTTFTLQLSLQPNQPKD